MLITSLAAAGNHATITPLVNCGADVNLQTSGTDESTALIMAVKKGHYKVVEELLKHDVEAFKKDKQGWGAFHYAEDK